MNILEVDSIIIKWENNNQNFIGKMIESDNPKFDLTTAPGIKILNVKDNIYLTNVDTDFILDIYVDSIIRFDTDKTLTIEDLYEIYCKIKDNESKVIFEDNDLKRLWYLIHLNQGISKRPFDNLKEDLKVLLRQSPGELN